MSEKSNGTIKIGTGMLILFLVIAAQYIITSWVVQVGSDEKIIGYVSFAGTVVSIILAVLAIVYAYFQTFTQQRDTATLSVQVDLIKEAVRDVHSGAASLAKDIGRFSELSEKIDRTIEISQESHAVVRDLQKKISASEKSQSSETPPGAASAITRLTVQQQQRLIGKASSAQAAIYFAIICGAQKNLTVDEIFDGHVLPAVKGGTRSSYEHGFFSATWYVLLDFRIIEIDYDKKLNLREPQFAELFAKGIPPDKEKDARSWIDVARVRATFPS